MVKDTHCEATLHRGPTWGNAILTSRMSGTPEGVISMLFNRLAMLDIASAEKLLETLQEELSVFQTDNSTQPESKEGTQ